MYVGQEEAPAAKPAGMGWGQWFLKAADTYFDYNVAQSRTEAASILQSQGMTPVEAQAAIQDGYVPSAPAYPSPLSNPLVLAGAAALGGIVLFKVLSK